MDDAELVGGALYDADDPIGAATVLARLLIAPEHDHRGIRGLGFEPALVESLRHALPRDPRALELACAKGAAWVLGRRSAVRQDGWEIVASVPADGELPAGLRRTTAETLIALIGEAERSLRFAAPYVDRAGMAIIAETLAMATARGVVVEVFEAKQWAFGAGATETLRYGVERLGDSTKLRLVRLATDAPWPHLKVMVADGRVAYIGSANITAAALMGRNLEVGVLVRGPHVAVIDSKYLIGEINADFMDANDQPDIVTSARQSVKEDDARYEAIKKFIQSILKSIQNRWTDLRNDVSLERALEHPGVKSWYDRLGGDKRRYARQVFGKIESLKSLDNDAKKELYKQSLLAFERLAFKESLHILDTIDTPEEFETLARLFGQIDELEAVYYHEIAKGRIEIVRQFERVLPDKKERLLQGYIFDHLWLLDPSWERAASNQRIEESVTQEFKDVDAGLTAEEKAGRIDIRYRTAAGKHIIIELKKYDRKVTVEELLVQVRKYRDALDKCLRTKFPHEIRVIETICVLGSPPEPHDQAHEQENIDLLRRVGARYITYDTLIQQSLQSYQDYLEKSRHLSELIAMVDSLDQTFDRVSSPPSESMA